MLKFQQVLPLILLTKAVFGIPDDSNTNICVVDVPSAARGNKYLSGTLKRTDRDVRSIKAWLKSKGLPFHFENMEDSHLNDLLTRFYSEARTRDNKPFTRHTLVNYRSSLNRYLTDLPPQYKHWQNLMNNPAFVPSNKLLDERVEEERKREKFIKSKPILPEDLEKLMVSGIIGNENPLQLQRKVWIDLVLHFGIKGNHAMWTLTKESFILQTDENQRNYFRINHSTEVAKMEINSEMKDWYWSARMYEIPGSPFCPVASLCTYLSALSPNVNYLFQRPVEQHNKSGYWYVKHSGAQAINTMFALISRDANLSTNYTNTSIRSTVTELLLQYGQNIDFMFASRNRYSINAQMPPLTTPELYNNSVFIHKLFYKTHYPEFNPNTEALRRFVHASSEDLNTA